MDNRRFNRDEISRILKRAAELEHKNNVDDDSEGLTLEELQQVSREVGLHPKYIEDALNELQHAPRTVIPNLVGGPFTYQRWDTAGGTLAGDEWEEVVAEIRRIHGGIGKTGTLGHTFEWEQRKQEVGYIQIALSPKDDHTKIRIQANYNYYAGMVYMMSGVLGLALTGVLLDGSSLPVLAQWAIGATGMLGIFAGARLYLSNWMKRKRNTYAKLIDRFREILKTGAPTESSPVSSSITMAETERLSETDNRSSSGGRMKS